MATDTRANEQQKAELSKRRGQAAAQISDPEERRKFIADQGDTEAKNKGELSSAQHERLSLGAALKGYKKGIDRVPETGPAILHKDEAVLNKEDAAEYRAGKRKKMAKKKATEVLGGKKKHGKKSGSKKKVHRMHIRHAANGGYIAEHEYKGDGAEPTPDREEFQLGDMDALHNHIDEHMDQSEPQAAPEPSPAPSSAAGPSPAL